MKIETVKISTLLNDPANVRKHDQRNLASIKASLAKFGQQKPIVVGSDNVVIAGNGTLIVAKELGLDEIVVVRTSLTGAEAIAYAIADNRTAELAEWSDELGEVLKSLDVDLQLAAGFDEGELEKLLGGGIEPVPIDEQSPLDGRSPVTCPECGHVWIPN